ncbi:unnamed protein product, partial [Ectocarpus fasciculatus]
MTRFWSRRRSLLGRREREPTPGSSGNKPPKLWPDAAAGKSASIKKFLRNGGHVDARNKDTMWTLLHTACHAGQSRVVE